MPSTPSTLRRRGSRIPVSRIAGVAGGTMAALLSQIVCLSVISYTSSSSAWAAVGLGQSIGGVAAIACTFGWNLSGPTRWADSPAPRRTTLYADSLVNRLIVTVATAPLVVVACWALAPAGEGVLVLSMAAATLLSVGVAPTWFNIAEGHTAALNLYNFLPRSAASLGAAALVLLGAPPIIYPALLLALSVLATVVFTVKVLTRSMVRLSGIGGIFRSQVRMAAIDFMGGAFGAANIALVASQVSVPDLAAYTSGQRVYQLGILSLMVLSQSLQGWTVDPAADRTHRGRIALKAHVLLGVVGGLAMGLVGPTISGLLFSDANSAPLSVTCLLAVSFFFVCCGTGTGVHVLIPHGQQRILMWAALTALVLGVPGVLLLAHYFGLVGGALGLAISQLGSLLVQIPATRRILARR
jgi:O-antigen/teichoic acid export membrane protein